MTNLFYAATERNEELRRVWGVVGASCKDLASIARRLLSILNLRSGLSIQATV